jgi:hypothetical protein
MLDRSDSYIEGCKRSDYRCELVNHVARVASVGRARALTCTDCSEQFGSFSEKAGKIAVV